MRTLDEFFNRMIVIDRRLAIIPGAADLTVAMAIREPGLVTYLVDVFERAWERARPFTNTERSMMHGIAKEQRAMTIRMLIEGHSDPVSAKRLGVSARTFAGYVADLKAEYDAETRFQLGYTMGQAGVSGTRVRLTQPVTGATADEERDGTGGPVPFRTLENGRVGAGARQRPCGGRGRAGSRVSGGLGRCSSSVSEPLVAGSRQVGQPQRGVGVSRCRDAERCRSSARP